MYVIRRLPWNPSASLPVIRDLRRCKYPPRRLGWAVSTDICVNTYAPWRSSRQSAKFPDGRPATPKWLAVDTAGRRLFVSPGGDGHRILVYRYWHRIAKEHFSRGSDSSHLGRRLRFPATRGFGVVLEHLCAVGRRSENSA